MAIQTVHLIAIQHLIISCRILLVLLLDNLFAMILTQNWIVSGKFYTHIDLGLIYLINIRFSWKEVDKEKE